MQDEHAFLWALPALVAVCIVLQLVYGRVAVGRWRTVEKRQDVGRYWLFIVAESLLVLILIGQAGKLPLAPNTSPVQFAVE